VVGSMKTAGPRTIDRHANITHDGRTGTLFVTQAASLLQVLKDQPGSSKMALPHNAAGMSRRLGSTHFRRMLFLSEKSAPKLPMMKRTSGRRPFGFFAPNDAVTTDEITVTAETPVSSSDTDD